jgi:3-oxoacyl-[acyl-carrier protein] reductase
MSAGRVALVTGSSRGIGRAIALALAGRGWQIGLNYRQNRAAAAEAEAACAACGAPVLCVQADIARSADRQRLLEAVLARFGTIDLLVNNAGMAPRRRVDLLEASEAGYDEVMAANLKGPYFLTQAVARAMIAARAAGQQESGMIVNIGSVSAYAASPERGEYCLSKAGLAMLTALFAARLAEYGINVYEVRAGIIATDMTGPVKEKYDRLIEGGLTPIPRWGQPEDVARAVVAIAEGALPFSTGAVIDVDGGFHIRRL